VRLVRKPRARCHIGPFDAALRSIGRDGVEERLFGLAKAAQLAQRQPGPALDAPLQLAQAASGGGQGGPLRQVRDPVAVALRLQRLGGAAGLPAGLQEVFEVLHAGRVVGQVLHHLAQRHPVGWQQRLRVHHAVGQGAGVHAGELVQCIGHEHHHHGVRGPGAVAGGGAGLRARQHPAARVGLARAVLRGHGVGALGHQRLAAAFKPPAQAAQR